MGGKSAFLFFSGILGDFEKPFFFFWRILGDYPAPNTCSNPPPVVPGAVKIQPEAGNRTEAGSRKAHIIAKNGSIFDCTMQG